MIPILIGVTLITFLLFNVVVKDPALSFAGKNATAERLAQIRAEIGTDRPLAEQYFFSLKQIATLNFGKSWATKQRISTMIKEGLGPTLGVMVPAFAASIIISVSLALGTALLRGTRFDKFVTIACLALMSISSMVYIMFFQNVLAYRLGLFPISGWGETILESLPYLVLPWIIYIVLSIGPDLLIFRSAVLDEFHQDYVRTAKAKGLPMKVILFKHVLKNALIPIITIVVLAMPLLITGSVLMESFFGIPGLGGMLVYAINNSDFPTIRAMVVIGTMLYMLFSLLADVLYAVVNPRIRLG